MLRRNPECRGTTRPDESTKTRKMKFFGCSAWLNAQCVCVSGRGPTGPERAEAPLDLLFVGEAPGAEEDLCGVAFVGRAGKLFDAALEDKLPAGIRWYVSNAVRCYPGKAPNGAVRKPTAEAMKACLTYLEREVEALKPRYIVAMGAYATAQVLGLPVAKSEVTRRSGRVWLSRFRRGITRIPCFVMRHPAWALRDMEGNLALWAREWEALNRLLATGQAEPQLPGKWKLLTLGPEIKAFYDGLVADLVLGKRRRIVLDYETTGLDWYKGADFLQIGYGLSEDEAVVVDIREHRDYALDRHKEVLRAAAHVVFHNFPFDGTFGLGHLGKLPSGFVWDTKAMAYLVNENVPMSLESQVNLWLPELSSFKNESNDFEGEWVHMPPEVLGRRCAYDCMASWRLVDVLAKEMTPRAMELYQTVVEPMLKVLCHMRVRGWCVDKPLLASIQRTVAGRVQELKAAIEEFQTPAGQPLNPDSPKQVAETLMTFGIQDEERQPNNPELISTTKDVLERHVGDHPLVKLLLDYTRNIGHVERADHYLAHLHSRAGQWFLLPGYNWGGRARQDAAAATVTGRLSSAKPNVMNPPKLYRRCFVSRFPGGCMVSADYSQLELRLVAAAAKEEALLSAFREGRDPHGEAAADIAKVVGVAVDRQIGKRLNFAAVYGSGPDTIYEQIQRDAITHTGKGVPLTRSQVRAMYHAWWDSRPACKLYMQGLQMQATVDGMVRGLFGQDRHIDAARSGDPKERARALRQLGNFPIQNGGAVITLRAMVEVEKALAKENRRALLIGQMHDSLILDCPRDEVPAVTALLKRVMRDEMNFWLHERVPNLLLDVDVKVGYDLRASKVTLKGGSTC